MDNVPAIKPMNEMSPREWFVYVRHKHGYDVPFASPKSALEDFLARIPASDRDKAREVWTKRYTMTIPEIQDELMQQYLEPLMPVLKTEERDIAETTFFGILPTHDFNGYAGFTPRGDRVIILHEGLVHTLSFWSSWYLRVMEESGKDFLIDNPEELSVALSYILSVWYGSMRPPRLPDVYPKDKDSLGPQRMLDFRSHCICLGARGGSRSAWALGLQSEQSTKSRDGIRC